MPGAGIIRNAGSIRGRALYEEIRYVFTHQLTQNTEEHCTLTISQFYTGLFWTNKIL